MKIKTIDELILAAHEMAVDKGWWEGERSVVDQVNNFHAEISEAWEEYRAGRMARWWSHDGVAIDESEIDGNDRFRWDGNVFMCGTRWSGHDGWSEFVTLKPEGFWVEIADLCIRLADTMGAYGWQYSAWRFNRHAKDHLPLFLSGLHADVSKMWCVGLEDSTFFINEAAGVASSILRTAFDMATVCGVDLWAVIAEKMAYNATRPIRHGGKKA